MRKILISAVVLLAVAGCRERTQIMLGVVTDLRAPKALDQVRLHVDGDNVNAFDQTWDLPGIPNVPFILPGSYGIYSPDGSERKVHVSLTGWKNNVQQLERLSLVSLVSGQTLFLRLGLVAGCVGKNDCATDETCIEGLCKPQLVDSRRLPRYTSETQIAAVECKSGPQYLDTSTGDVIPPTGTSCNTGTFCEEGTCYNQLPSDDLGPDQAVVSDLGDDLGPDLATPDLSTPDLALPLQWTSQLSPTTEQLNAVWATSGLVVAVGNNGVAARLGDTGPASSSSWVVETTGVTEHLHGIGGNDVNFVYVVGNNGVVLWRDYAANWNGITNSGTPFTEQFHAVWPDPTTVGSNNLWLFGSDFTGKTAAVYRNQGEFGNYTPSGVGPINAVFGVSADDFWAVGDALGVLRGSDQDMSYQPSGSANFQGVWVGGNRVVAVDSDGSIYESDGTTIFTSTHSASTPLYAVWGTSPTAIWAVGAGGTILYSTSTGNWQPQTTGTTNDLRGISGSADGVYVVGSSGTILFQPAPPPPPDDGGTAADLAVPPDLSIPPDMALPP